MPTGCAMLFLSSRSLIRPLKSAWSLNYVSRTRIVPDIAKTSFVYYSPNRFYCEKKPTASVTSILNAASSSGSSGQNDRKSPDKDEDAKNAARATKWTAISVACMIGMSLVFAITEYGPPELDEDGKEKTDEYSSKPIYLAYLLRTRDALISWNKKIKEPSRDLLLPEPMKPPYYQPPYTILIELNGLLTHPDWTYKTGWRFKKRPFVDYFIQACGYPNAELIVFTQDPGHVAEPIIDSLDRQGSIIYRLYRDSTVS